MKQTEVYIGGEKGGIPDSIFQPGPWQEFLGLNTKLEGMVTPLEIDIRDAENYSFFFNAKVTPDNLISFSINNRNLRGNRDEKQPDIYPLELAKRAYKYFIEQGHAINGIAARWTKYRDGTSLLDNYDQYFAYLKSLPKRGLLNLWKYSEDEKMRAAKQTWTGKMAATLGFTEVDKVKEKIEDSRTTISTTFRKPTDASQN